MKVKELIKRLKQEDPERLVILSRDAEGNGYSPLAESFYIGGYMADSTWSGEIGYEELTPEMMKEGYTEEELCSEDAEPCLVMYPVN